jgi:hypothetical protein
MWDIDLDADSPEEAAKQALEIQRDPESTATYFTVQSAVQTEYKEEPVGIDL